MDTPSNFRLGNLQLKIMQALWDLRKATISEVHEQLVDDQLAYNTVATMLRKMEAKGLVTHRTEDRRYIYEPVIAADVVTRSMSSDLVERLFSGSLAQTMSHLLQTHEISPQELKQLETLIQQEKEKRKKK